MQSPARPSAPIAAAPGSAALVLSNVSRWYGNVVAVNDVSCTLGPGVTGVLGPNGAGKTTVLHMMAGLLRPSAGTILLDGEPTAGRPEIYRRLALVPEREAVHPYLTGREFVHMSARLQRLPDAKGATERAIALVEMEEAQDRKIGTYSKGMRQRIKIAGALVHDPAVLLLDEPFNGMDPRQRLHMIELLRATAAMGSVVVISSHILEELNDLATNVLVMVSGRLAASGHFREIRKLMTDRPHTFHVRSTDDRKLCAAILGHPSVFSVELAPDGATVRTSDRGAFALQLPVIARALGIRLLELRPTDESLESVFSYLVER
jgi:ABC-2 type transport system ATP-binding protein